MVDCGMNVPIIYLAKKDNKEIRESTRTYLIQQMYARLSDFFTDRGVYKIRESVVEAQKKNVQSYFEKDLIKVDKRVGLLYNAMSLEVF